MPALEFVLTRIWEASGREFLRRIRCGNSAASAAPWPGRPSELYQSLSGDQKTIARRAFLAMTMLGEGTKDTRRRAPIDEMVAAGQSEDDVRRVLEIFADPDRRLITLAADKDGRTIAEVAHEALFEHWTQLQEWLARGRDDLRFQRRLTAAAAEWADHPQRAGGATLAAPLLDLLEEYRRRHAADMTSEQLEFLEVCKALRARREQEAEDRQRAETERQRLVAEAALQRESDARSLARRTRWFAVGSGILALLAVGFGGYSIRQEERARLAEVTAPRRTR